MKFTTGFLITLYVVLSISTRSMSARSRKDKDRKKDKYNPQLGGSNLCMIEDNTAAFRCFCDGGGALGNVSNAECWVFGSLSREHSVWFLFSSQPRITELKFLVRPDGQLNFIPTKGLEYLKELKKLTVWYGDVEEIHPYAFANLTELQELNLDKNQIVALDHHAFAHLVNLTELNLDDNRISELNKNVFVDLPNLQKLYVDHNNLTTIQEGAFRYLSHLVELEMRDNFITVLTKDTFTGLSELKRLDLSFNNISMLGDLTFAELWVLEELLLDRNDIEFISDRAFAGLTHLRKLVLSHNRLTSLVNNVFDGIPAIYYLDLRSNLLQTLTYENVRPILHNLRNRTSYFYPNDNKYVCDCRLLWIYALRNETRSDHIRDILQQVTCYMEPSEGKDLSGEFEDDYTYESEEGYVYEQQNYVTIPEPRSHVLRYLLQIPPTELPCPQKLKNPTDVPGYPERTPAYAEINSNEGYTPRVSSIISVCTCTLIMIFIT